MAPPLNTSCTNSFWKTPKMNDTTGTGSAPESQGQAQVQKPGDLIRSKREAAGMSQAQVGEALHLTVHYVKSLESDEYSKLPGLTFVKGYFRAYARLLKLDEAAILDCYDRYVGTLALQTGSQEHTMRVRRRNDQAILWAVVAGVILVVGLGAGWWFFGRHETGAPAAVVATLPRSDNSQSTAPDPQRPAQSSIQANARTSTQASPQTPPQSSFQAASPMTVVTEPVAETPVELEARVDPQALPDTTTLMTEDGPLVLADDTDAVVNAAVVTVAVVADGTAVASSAPLVLRPALDAPGAALVPAGNSTGQAPAGAVDAADVSAAVVAATATPAADTAANTVAQAETAAETAAADSAAAADVVTSTGTNTRRVELAGTGSDQLELQFSVNSWVEVDDGARARLYGDMMRNGDVLSIRATAPFYVLLGDATGVSVLLNGQMLPIAANIRSDKTARIRISAEGLGAWVVE